MTSACLQKNVQFRRVIGDDDDAVNMTMAHIQDSSNVSTHFLSRNGLMEMFSKIMLKISDGVAFDREKNLTGHYSQQSLSCNGWCSPDR